MLKHFKNNAAALLVIGVLVLASAWGAGLKVWVSGEPVTGTDLNSNFNYINSTVVGGRGARLVNADVSGSAAIASSKLAQGAGMADAYVVAGYSAATCTVVGACATYRGYGVTSVAKVSLGTYTVTWAANYSNPEMVAVTSMTEKVCCSAETSAAAADNFTTIRCRTCAEGVADAYADAAFSCALWSP